MQSLPEEDETMDNVNLSDPGEPLELPQEEPSDVNSDAIQSVLSVARNGNLVQLRQLLQDNPHLMELKVLGSTCLHLLVLDRKDLAAVKCVASCCKDIDVKDDKGSSPLHLAAIEDNDDIVEALLSFGANPALQNNNYDTPLHAAVRNGSLKALRKLLENGSINLEMNGWNGESPLHVAASLNQLDCAKILTERGADLFNRDDSGNLPIHLAAASGAVDVTGYFLKICATEPTSGLLEDMLNAVDAECQTPLHLAVHNGDPEMVRILLEQGPSIKLQMFEGSTALHLICAQGQYKILQMIHAFNVVDFDQAMKMRDAQGMTPLHRAAMFNHWEVFRFLIEKGGDIIDVQDSRGHTALVLAASCGSWDAVLELLYQNANPSICDFEGKNYLHHFVSLGGNPESLKNEIQNNKSGVGNLLNGQDNDGNTPLHIAASLGYSDCCETLIRIGAVPNIKNLEMRTPLHLAVSAGRYKTVQTLLNNISILHSINDPDFLGNTAIHIAAENGRGKIASLLLSNGAIMIRNNGGGLPIHSSCAMNKGEESELTEILLNSHPHLLDAIDNHGNTPLHIAAVQGNTSCINLLLKRGAKLSRNDDDLSAMDLILINKVERAAAAMIESERWIEILLQPSSFCRWPALGLIEHLPKIMLKVLDKCQRMPVSSNLSKDYSIIYDFRILEPKSDLQFYQPLEALNQMVKLKRVDLLQHPVSAALLESKWNAYGLYFHVINIALYIIFLILLTYLVFLGIEIELRPNIRALSKERILKYQPDWLANATRIIIFEFDLEKGDMDKTDKTLLALVLIFALLHLLKKCFQLYLHRQRFFAHLINYFEVTLYILTVAFAVGFYDEMDYYMSWRSQWLIGAVVILFAWMNFFFHLQRFRCGQMGMQVLTLMRVMRTLAEAGVVIFVVVLAFSLAFHDLYPVRLLPDDADFYTHDHSSDKPGDIYYNAHSTLQVAILRVTDQLVGDATVLDNWIFPWLFGQQIFPAAVNALGFISILVIGWTVGNISNIMKSIVFESRAIAVKMHSDIEEKLPQRLRNYFHKSQFIIYPNRTYSSLFKKFFKPSSPGSWVGTDSDDLDVSSDLFGFTDEITQQKESINRLMSKINQQHNLLRLVVERLDVGSETKTVEDPSSRKRSVSRYADGRLMEELRKIS